MKIFFFGKLIKPLLFYQFMKEENSKIMKILGKRYRYLSQDMLGKGTFGTVYRGQIIATKQPCAIKVIPKNKISKDLLLMETIWNQMNIQIQQKNDNIIRRISSQESPNNYYLIFELCESDLQSKMKNNPLMSQAQAIDILSQIVNGFSVLVPEGIMHRDLKPANILISNGIYKISDFGSSLFKVNDGQTEEASLYTIAYSPPQILRGDSYSNKCDIWSCGIIFYELLHGKHPWLGESRRKHLEAIQNSPLIIRNDLSAFTIDFLERALAKAQYDRLAWEEIFFHPIFKGKFNFLKSKKRQLEFNHKNFMKQLAYQITQRSIDIRLLLDQLGLQDSMSFQDFKKFICKISNDIPNQEILYIFNRLDQDRSETIEISQIQEQLDRNSPFVFSAKIPRFC